MVEVINVRIWQVMYASCTTVQGSGTSGNNIRINGYCREDPVTQLNAILKMEGTCSSETMISIYRKRGRYSPEYHNLNRYDCKNLKFCYSY